jgi:hypothetical protein
MKSSDEIMRKVARITRKHIERKRAMTERVHHLLDVWMMRAANAG